MPPALNKNHSAVKRIMQEARELAADTSSDYSAAPLEDDIFEWHGTLRGSAGTDYEGGLYHFRILLPAEYPFRPPAIQLLTPNGRFELNTNICISFTNYHEESWQPAWGVRTAIIGLQGFFPLNGKDAVGVGGIEFPPSERKRLAKLSRKWFCDKCGMSNIASLPDPHTSQPIDTRSSDASPGATEVTEPLTNAPAVILLDTAHTLGNVPSSSKTSPAPAPTPSSPPKRAAKEPLVSQSTAPRSNRHPPRPPVVLDTAICVLLVLVAALLCRKLL